MSYLKYGNADVRQMKDDDAFIIDLFKIKGTGDFKCPRCGTGISPDDKSEKTYKVLEAVMKGDDLEKIVLQCNKCGSKLQLVGFETLRQAD